MQEIDSASIEQIASRSTSNLAPALNEAIRRLRLTPFFLAVCFIILGIGISAKHGNSILLAVLFCLITTPVFVQLDRYRRSLRLAYMLNEEASVLYRELCDAFTNLANCRGFWHVTAAGLTTDWKRHAGAGELQSRKPISPKLNQPSCVRSNISFPSFMMGKEELFFAPDAVLMVTKSSVIALNYRDINLTVAQLKFVEDGTPPSDTMVVDETWRFVNKKGGPDRRFGFNRKLPVCLYGQMHFQSAGGLNELVQYSNPQKVLPFVSAIESMSAAVERGALQSSIRSVSYPNAFRTIATCLFVVFVAVFLFVAGTYGTAITNFVGPVGVGKTDKEPTQIIRHSAPATVRPLASTPVDVTATTVVSKGLSLDVTKKPPLPRPRPKNTPKTSMPLSLLPHAPSQ